MAISTRMPPRTRPVNTWAATAENETSNTRLREPLLGAGPIQFLVRGHLADHVEVAPLALDLLGRARLDDPEILEGLVVAGPPPLLALVVVVLAVLAERVGHGVGVRRLGLRNRFGQLVAEVGRPVDVLEHLGAALLRVVEEV